MSLCKPPFKTHRCSLCGARNDDLKPCWECWSADEAGTLSCPGCRDSDPHPHRERQEREREEDKRKERQLREEEATVFAPCPNCGGRGNRRCSCFYGPGQRAHGCDGCKHGYIRCSHCYGSGRVIKR